MPQLDRAHPGWQWMIRPEALVEIIKISIYPSHAHFWEGWQIRHDLCAFQLILLRTASAIAPPSQVEELIIESLLLVVAPGTKHIGRLERSVVGVRRRFDVLAGRGNKMCQSLCTIDA